MGTRSLTSIRENGKVLVNIYRQFDGYPEGHGMELARILASRSMTNGIPGDADHTKLFNGPGCMAAQIIRQLKSEDAGDIYVAAHDDDGGFCDYTYAVDVTSTNGDWSLTYSEPRLSVKGYGDDLFEGSAQEFIDWVRSEKDQDAQEDADMIED
jgi:hypothetical protein